MKKGHFYVFFDVDGVLNKESDWIEKYTINPRCIRYFYFLNRELRKRYEKIHYILISTWRAGISNNNKELDSKQIKNLETSLNEIGIRIDGSTPISDKGRQAEVEFYIKRYGVNDYIIIDDDPSLFTNPSSINLYSPDYRCGLTCKDAERILEQIKRGKKRSATN